MSLFKKLRGIIGGYLQLDNTNTANGIANNINGIEARTNNNAAQSNFVSAQALGGTTTGTDANCSNLLDLKQRALLIEFSFPGLVPAFGSAGQYGICHTSGGIYVAGQIYLSDGISVLTAIPMYKMQNVCNINAFSGTVSMIANGFYSLRSIVSPWTVWELMGDGGGGGGFTAGGDLTGTSTNQKVSYIDGIPTPAAVTADDGEFIRVSKSIITFLTPRSIVADGDDIWYADNDQGSIPAGKGFVTHYTISTQSIVLIDLVSILPGVDTNGVRDLAQDSTYIYCACWKTGNIAIIEKLTNVVLGWGAIPTLGFPGRQVTSVCADNAGKFYVVGIDDVGGNYIWRFDTASCIGQLPDIIGPELSQLTIKARKVRYGGGMLWLANGGGDPDCLHRFDPTTLTETGLFGSGVVNFGMDCIYAFGYVWVVDNATNQVWTIDPITMASIGPGLSTGFSQPNCIGIGPDSNGNPNSRLLVTNVFDNSNVKIIDPTGPSIEATISIGNVGAEQICSSGNKWYTASPDVGGPNAAVYTILGDLGSYTAGTLSGPTVLVYSVIDSIQGRPVSPALPFFGEFLGWDGSQWIPAAIPIPSITLAGDVTGPTGSNTVVGLQNRTLAATAPTAGQFIGWNAILSQWEPVTFAGGLPVATQAGDIVQWTGTVWQANQPQAGLVNVKLGQVVGAGSAVVLELDRTGATQELLAYLVKTENDIVGFDVQNNVATWRGFSALFGVYSYDAVGLTNRTLVVAWVEGGNVVHVRSLSYTYNPPFGTWTLAPTIGVDTTIYTGTAITDVTIDYLGSNGVTGQQFVVGFIDTNAGSRGILVACTYLSDVVACTFGASYTIPTIVDMYSITVALDTFNESGSLRYDIAIAYGRSGTNTGFVAWTSVPQGSNTFSGGLSTSNSTFGTATIKPKCITIRRMETQDESNVRYFKIGILYGDTVRAAAIMKRPATGSYEYYFGAYNFTGDTTAWRTDADIFSDDIQHYLDSVIVNPGFGDIDESGLFFQLAQCTRSNFTERVVAISGSVKEQIPVANRPQMLVPLKASQWGIQSPYIRRLSENKYVWGARETFNPSSPGNDQIFFGIASIRDGRSHNTLGVSPHKNTSWSTFQIPSATQKYQKFVPVRMSDNRFVAVFSANSATVGGPACVAIHCICNDREKFFGFMQEAGAVGTTKRCVTVGGIDRSHSGLIPGMTYYLEWTDISTRSNGIPVGIAQSATTMLVVNNKRIQQVNNI